MEKLPFINRYADKIIKTIESGGKGLFYKIDWFTVLFNNASLSQVFRTLSIKVADDFGQFFVEHSQLVDPAYGRSISFCLEGIHFSLDYYDLMVSAVSAGYSRGDYKRIPVEFYLKTPCEKIRADTQGTGCDILRSKYIDVEHLVQYHIPLSGLEFHFTRIDFAYDFINYCPDFISNLRHICDEYQSNNGYISAGQNGYGTSGLSWNVKHGDKEESIYFGSIGSNCVLRCYDKRKERIKKKDIYGCVYTENGHLPDSWIRLELQTRRDLCEFLLFSDNYSDLSVLRYIFDRYAIREGNIHGDVVKDWIDLFDWHIIDHIIQNANFI